MSKPHLEVDLSRGFAYYSPPSLQGGAVVGDRPVPFYSPPCRGGCSRQTPIRRISIQEEACSPQKPSCFSAGQA